MQLGFQVFFVDDDGALRNIPWPTYVGLYFDFPSIRLPEYAGRAVRCVHVVVEMEDRVPVGMLESVFFLAHFNPEGGMDQDKLVERQRLAIDMQGSHTEGRQVRDRHEAEIVGKAVRPRVPLEPHAGRGSPL